MGSPNGYKVQARRRARSRAGRLALCALLLVVGATMALPGGSAAEQASGPTPLEGGQLDAGVNHSCVLLSGNVRCWGFNREGELGYGHARTIGDNETPAGA